MTALRTCVLRLLGVIMTVVAPLTIALGIIDVVLTSTLWCATLNMCNTITSPGLSLTWVAVGIWSPIPILLNGIAAVWITGQPCVNPPWLCMLSFISSFLFAPALLIISALEVSYKFPGGLSMLTTAYPAYASAFTALYSIEIIMAILGGVFHLHAVGVLYYCCCCRGLRTDDCTDTEVTSNQKTSSKINQTPACQEAELNNTSWMTQKQPSTPGNQTSYFSTGAYRDPTSPITGLAGPYGAYVYPTKQLAMAKYRSRE